MELSNCHHYSLFIKNNDSQFWKAVKLNFISKFNDICWDANLSSSMSNQLLKNYAWNPQQMHTLLQWTIQNQAQHLQRQPQAHHDNRNCSLTNSLNVVIKSLILNNSADSVNFLKSNLVSWVLNKMTFKHAHYFFVTAAVEILASLLHKSIPLEVLRDVHGRG